MTEEKPAILFTNGVFDLLHTGHVDFLKKIWEEAEELRFHGQETEVVVGINSDASVKRLKGPHRPVFNEHDRKMMLESLKYVDRVIIYPTDTAVELIEMLRPWTYYKGYDYLDKSQTMEHRAALYIGAEVKFVMPPAFEIRHTTNIIHDIWWTECQRRAGIE
jgi:rfaE bifunctional protein nucleotidyltransferase chain/domain